MYALYRLPCRPLCVATLYPILRSFFESVHFLAAVERVFIWLDINNELFLSAHQPQLVSTLRDVVAAAAKWAHVKLVVLPVPYAASLLTTFESFMQEFNKTHDLPPNVVSRKLR
ncbi:hypothetical protein AAVH_20375 [Aphelenchoides avenae]|nr:hypothetical protein AAVH_20375 [Aphelenchus avenae]